MIELSEELVIERNIIEKAGKMHWLHWLVVVSSLILTFSAWYISKKSIDDKTQIQFDRQTEQVVELISERMSKYEDALLGGVAAIKMKGYDTSYYDWKNFSTNLSLDIKYPGINGIGIIYYVEPEQLDSFLANQHYFRPEFEIYPKHNRKIYLPITYIEPFEINKQAVGLDMAHETNRFSAAIKARDSATTQITGPITLVQDSNKTPGFLFYAPFYKSDNIDSIEERRQNFVGMVYAPFVVKKLMEGTLQSDKRSVGIKISDGGEVLYDEDQENASSANAQFRKKMELSLYGRLWVFDIWSKEAFHKNTDSNQPIIVLIGGILIDTLLLTLFILLANSNHRAINFIKKVTSKE